MAAIRIELDEKTFNCSIIDGKIYNLYHKGKLIKKADIQLCFWNNIISWINVNPSSTDHFYIDDLAYIKSLKIPMDIYEKLERLSLNDKNNNPHKYHNHNYNH